MEAPLFARASIRSQFANLFANNKLIGWRIPESAYIHVYIFIRIHAEVLTSPFLRRVRAGRTFTSFSLFLLLILRQAETLSRTKTTGRNTKLDSGRSFTPSSDLQPAAVLTSSFLSSLLVLSPRISAWPVASLRGQVCVTRGATARYVLTHLPICNS